MPLTDSQREALQADLDPALRKEREGPGGRPLTYIDQGAVKAAMNRVFGHGRWSYQTLACDCLGTEEVQSRGENPRDGFKVAYRAHVQVLLSDEAASYSDWGYCDDVSYTSALEAHEMALKGAVSDAFKRAAAALGNQFGLSLYEEAAERRADADAKKRGKQRPGRGGRSGSAAKVAAVTDADLRRIHAKRNELKISERDLKRVMRFCADLPLLTSGKEFPRGMVNDLLGLLDQFQKYPDTAGEKLAQFEAETGAPALPEEAAA